MNSNKRQRIRRLSSTVRMPRENLLDASSIFEGDENLGRFVVRAATRIRSEGHSDS